MSPDALTGLEANLRFAGKENMVTRIFGRLTAWQNWIFQRPERGRPQGRAQGLRHRREGRLRFQPRLNAPTNTLETHAMAIDYSQKIPNNVNLADDRTLQRALEQWQPNFINWWDDVGPEGSTNHEVYLRTATSVDPQGWAHFDYVKMRDYRWGIFLNPADAERKIHFGDHKGEKAWQDVPGEHRANLRRIIVTQGDTEPASVEQQRHLGLTAPSLYDLRNLFQVNVEEGRHLWAMVYLLQKFFGRDGREEAGRAARAHLGRRRTTRASSAPSTRRRPTGWRSSCSPTSPTATASSSSPPWPRAPSIRWRARPSSC